MKNKDQKHTFFSFLSLFGKLSSFITAWLKTTRKKPRRLSSMQLEQYCIV